MNDSPLSPATAARARLDEELETVARLSAAAPVAMQRLRPKDAATLIVLDTSAGEPKVLMGRRNARVKFMPNKFVFPGGRVEVQDRSVPVAGILEAHVEARLMAGSPGITASRCRSLALAAIRETFEETGIMLGTKDHGPPPANLPGTWATFAEHGVMPNLDGLRFVARAITPPNRSRRFDTRFFAVNAREIAHRIDRELLPDDELTELRWIPLSEAKTIDVPGITLVILEEVIAKLGNGLDGKHPVPFYRYKGRTFIREEI